jgi:D-serine deaminase-like pyridoxal phosphate-dependent protein
MVYPGHIWEAVDEQDGPLRKIDELLGETIALWSRYCLSAAIVSGGSTPTAYQSHVVTNLTEIRPGTYIFNDMNTVRGGFCSLDDCAARVIATVISDAIPGQVVIDAGSKTLSNDLCIPARDSGHGHVVEYPLARVTRLSEEHGQLDISACDPKPTLGERVSVIPNHICPCVNLQESVWWKAPDRSLSPIPVDARGRIQ